MDLCCPFFLTSDGIGECDVLMLLAGVGGGVVLLLLGGGVVEADDCFVEGGVPGCAGL